MDETYAKALGLTLIPCGLCGAPTHMRGTKRCDRCYELETRIRADPKLARRILEGLKV